METDRNIDKNEKKKTMGKKNRENVSTKNLLELYQQHRAMIPLLIVYQLMGPFGFYLIPDVLSAVHHFRIAQMHRYVSHCIVAKPSIYLILVKMFETMRIVCENEQSNYHFGFFLFHTIKHQNCQKNAHWSIGTYKHGYEFVRQFIDP